MGSRRSRPVGGHPIPVLGRYPVYGARFEGLTGYRNDTTTGMAVGDQAESIFAVFSGTHYNNFCCFDYGNAETDNKNDHTGTMEALYRRAPRGLARVKLGIFAGDAEHA